MLDDKKYVTQLREKIKGYANKKLASVIEIFPGFSKRLNFLIDQTDLQVPGLDSGRQAYLSTLLGVSRMAPGDWLKKDRPPKMLTLRGLIEYFLHHLPHQELSVNKIEAWLKYGEEVVPNPFMSQQDNDQALIPLATTLIVSIAKENQIATTQFDLNDVLNATIQTLIDFELRHEDAVEKAHRKIISQHLYRFPKK